MSHKTPIYLSLAKMTGNEQKYIQEAFDTNWVVPLGPNVDAFERELADFLGVEHVVALSSGTAAIHLGLIMLGVGPGDEVMCQSFTFAASVNPVIYLGASPVLVDSSQDCWNMDPKLLDQAIADRIAQTGKKPKAIIPVYLYGMPAHIDEILAVGKKYDIPVLEDACEALGSEYKGKKCGTFGQYGALSFNGNKMITTSGGGALICPDEASAQRVKFYATQARDANSCNEYWHSKIGYNYRMSNICAGIGRGQMTEIHNFISRRRQIHQMYTESLSDVPGISIQQNPHQDFNSNFWLTTILVNPTAYGFDRNQLAHYLREENIESRPLWKPMHLQEFHGEYPFYGNGIADTIFNVGLCLPSGSCLKDDDIKRVINVISRFRG